MQGKVGLLMTYLTIEEQPIQNRWIGESSISIYTMKHLLVRLRQYPGVSSALVNFTPPMNVNIHILKISPAPKEVNGSLPRVLSNSLPYASSSTVKTKQM